MATQFADQQHPTGQYAVFSVGTASVGAEYIRDRFTIDYVPHTNTRTIVSDAMDVVSSLLKIFGNTLIPVSGLRESEMSTLQDIRRKETHTRVISSLTDETRRRVVRNLRGETDVVSVAELAERLAAPPTESVRTDGESDALKTVRVRLHHIHLPKLADNDLVNWDRDAGTVAATDHPVYDER